MNVRPVERLHPSGQRVQAALDAAGLSTRIVETLEPSPTAQAAAAQLDIEIGQVANSLVFEADGEAVLVMTSGQHRVDTRRLAAFLGVSAVQRPDATFVKIHTGQPIGGVAPIGHPTPLRTVVDDTLGRWPVIWAAGGHPRYVFATTYEDLVRLTHGTTFDVGVR